LIIFDDLDKVPPSVGDHLFFDYAAQLQQLKCVLIYTVPISVIYSPKRIDNYFTNPNVMPMVNVYHLDQTACDLAYNQQTLSILAKLIEKRIVLDKIFVEPSSMLELAKASGGHVRQLVRMMLAACLTAYSHGKIRPEDVIKAIKQERFSFERLELDYDILARVCLEKNAPRDEENFEKTRSMLFSTAILEYNGEERWNYINPLIKDIRMFQKALNKLQGG